MIPSAGNAGGAAAVYGARAGMPVARRGPARARTEAAIAEALLAGAHVFTVDGTIATAGKLIAGVAPRIGWFDLATLKEPYRLEGKKTMGLELAEQLGWETPDVLVYPTGGGTGLVGIWKAYDELAALGWIKASAAAPSSPSRPRDVRPWSRRGRTGRGRHDDVGERGHRCAGPARARPVRRPADAQDPPRDRAATAARSASVRSSTPNGSSRASRASGPSPEGAANVAALIQMKDARRGRRGHARDDGLHRLRASRTRRRRCPRRSIWRAATRTCSPASSRRWASDSARFAGRSRRHALRSTRAPIEARPGEEPMNRFTRRDFLKRSGAGLGLAAASVAGLRACASGVKGDFMPKTTRRVVVIGGGWGGATAAKYVRLEDPGIEVVMLEPNREFISCPFSNLVLSGLRTMASITLKYDGLARARRQDHPRHRLRHRGRRQARAHRRRLPRVRPAHRVPGGRLPVGSGRGARPEPGQGAPRLEGGAADRRAGQADRGHARRRRLRAHGAPRRVPLPARSLRAHLPGGLVPQDQQAARQDHRARRQPERRLEDRSLPRGVEGLPQSRLPRVQQGHRRRSGRARRCGPSSTR